MYWTLSHPLQTVAKDRMNKVRFLKTDWVRIQQFAAIGPIPISGFWYAKLIGVLRFHFEFWILSSCKNLGREGALAFYDEA